VTVVPDEVAYGSRPASGELFDSVVTYSDAPVQNIASISVR